MSNPRNKDEKKYLERLKKEKRYVENMECLWTMLTSFNFLFKYLLKFLFLPASRKTLGNIFKFPQTHFHVSYL